jgi:hypothetical protein
MRRQRTRPLGAALLKGLVLDDEIMGWVTEALRQSHSDAKQHHDAAIARLHAEYNRLQSSKRMGWAECVDETCF